MENFRYIAIGRIYKCVLRPRIVMNCLHSRLTCSSRITSFLCVGSHLQTLQYRFSHLPSSASKVILENGCNSLTEEFPNPKEVFLKVINEASVLYQSHDLKPDLHIEVDSSCKGSWKATLSMKWPENFTVEAKAKRKTEAERLAYTLVCKKFRDFGLLDSKNYPVLLRSQVAFDDSELKMAKSRLSNAYNAIWPRFGRRDLLPVFKTSEVKGLFGNCYWRCELSLKYPTTEIFNGLGSRLQVAEQIAAAKALCWLCEKGIINKDMQPILYSKEEEKEMHDNQMAPYPLSIPPNLQLEMKEVLEHFKELEANFNKVGISSVEEHFQSTKASMLCDNISDFSNEDDSAMDWVESTDKRASPMDWSEIESHENNLYWDIITEKPLQEYSDEELKDRSWFMYDKYTKWKTSKDPKVVKILKEKMELPIFKKKEDILRLISENQVVVLLGETGSGKTTQVPQYIIESYISKLKGSECNIVITQPRRISAISIAARVASERGEAVGETVGHQVRFDKILPKGKGALLFCSTGILLRKLCRNPNLDGVSHVIIDEVHERNVQIDFLLILLKNLLNTNKNIKIILMSATFNSEVFSQYFNNCPVINVPGFIYPVEQIFLDDITRVTEYQNNSSKVNFELIADTIKDIHMCQPPGAILCFLPGWNEIKTVFGTLQDKLNCSSSKYVIYPVHSRLSHDKQKRIFNRFPDDVRKIILATNVAETSITINDVVYVVDSGFQKESSFCAGKGTAALGIRWISRANVQQRKGRAGRVKPGVCYHLYPKKIFEAMGEYPTPEMHRMPLENVILDCKLYAPDMKAEDFLSLAVEPPQRDSIQHGVKELQLLEILDENEKLTTLGKRIVNFTSHPRLSKALVMGAFLRCLDPILTSCAFMTRQDSFINSLENKDEIRKIKEDYDQELCSDHLTMCNIYNLWPGSTSETDTSSYFVAANKLDEDSLIFVKRLKGLFAEHLYEAGLIDDQHSFANPEAKCNENSSCMNIVLSALGSAFYPNIIKITQGEKKRGRIYKDTIIYSTVRGPKAFITKDSVAYKKRNLPSVWFIYFSAVKSEARMSLLPREVSLVPGICLPLFAGCDLSFSASQMIPEDNINASDMVTLKIDNFNSLSFCCSSTEGELLKDFRRCAKQVLHLQLTTVPEISSFWLSVFHEKYVPSLLRLLNTSQAPFVQGKKFYLEENKLIAEDLD